MPVEVEEEEVDAMHLLSLIDVTPPYLRLSSLKVNSPFSQIEKRNCGAFCA